MNINFKIYKLLLLTLVISMNVNGATMNGFYFDGEQYNDDRMFVLFVAKCTTRETDELVSTTIYHEEAPDNHKWCVATFKNVARYMASKTDIFETESEAISYLKKVEPRTPLISLGGSSPANPMSFEEYSKWKHDKNYRDYDYKNMFTFGGTNPQETLRVWKHL